ncbi:MAG: hypothetical protein NT062_11730 [Proteobacteria bacterium]|nr:hypothetical protein [Pseudomonadota bacterium]
MSEPSVLVSFRLEPSTPVRIQWLATDGNPLDGYKAQIVAITLPGGVRLAMDTSAILEQVVTDPLGGVADFLMTFTGMVGYASDHADRPAIDAIPGDGASIHYELTFVHESGRVAVEDADYRISHRPHGLVRKLSK